MFVLLCQVCEPMLLLFCQVKIVLFVVFAGYLIAYVLYVLVVVVGRFIYQCQKRQAARDQPSEQSPHGQ